MITPTMDACNNNYDTQHLPRCNLTANKMNDYLHQTQNLPPAIHALQATRSCTAQQDSSSKSEDA